LHGEGPGLGPRQFFWEREDDSGLKMRWIGCDGPARQIDPVDRSGAFPNSFKYQV